MTDNYDPNIIFYYYKTGLIFLNSIPEMQSTATQNMWQQNSPGRLIPIPYLVGNVMGQIEARSLINIIYYNSWLYLYKVIQTHTQLPLNIFTPLLGNRLEWPSNKRRPCRWDHIHIPTCPHGSQNSNFLKVYLIIVYLSWVWQPSAFFVSTCHSWTARSEFHTKDVYFNIHTKCNRLSQMGRG